MEAVNAVQVWLYDNLPVGVAISVEGAREGGEAKITVADTGIGIAPEQLRHIFQRFQQAGR